MSLRPSTVRFFSCVMPAGSLRNRETVNFLKKTNAMKNFGSPSYRGMGFEEKSAICSAWHPLICSGISGISERNKSVLYMKGSEQAFFFYRITPPMFDTFLLSSDS